MSQREELFERKRHAMELMDGGISWEEANEKSGLNYSRTGIQRLYCEWKARGDEALIDNRHGHTHKATAEVLELMENRCEEEPEVRASQLVAEIDAEFGVELTQQYVTVLRRQLGLPVPRPGNPGKQEEPSSSHREPEVEAQRAEEEPAPERKPEGDFSPS